MSTPHPQLAGERAIALLSRANIERLQEFKSALSQVFPRLDIVAPDDLDHLGHVVKRSHGVHKLVLAIGGDGMLHQVLQQINLAEQVLGVLPAGTGNDFARSLDFPKPMRQRIARLAQLKPQPTDFGLLNEVRFINSGGFGLDAATLRVRHTHSGLLHSSYQAAFLYALARMKPWELEVDVDGEIIEGRFYWPLAMNTPYIGGGVKIAPQARLDDGLLDIVLIKETSKLNLVLHLPATAKGQHLGLPETIYRQARMVVCQASRPVDWMAVDGEERLCGSREVRFAAQAGALSFLR